LDLYLIDIIDNFPYMVICSLPLVNAVFLLSYVVFVRYLPETSAYAN